MDEQQARLILQAYRPGSEETDPDVAEAVQMAARDPDLGRWFAEEQDFDRAMAAHLESIPAPFGLKTRILAQATPAAVQPRPWSWAVKLAGIVALLFLLVQIASFFRPAAPPSALLGDYANEMVSFIRLSPPLEMMSDDLGKIEKWLAKEEIAPPNVPPRLAHLRPVGCRILSFRGQKVTLICFKRTDAGYAHLFVVGRAAMPQMKPGGKPVFAQEGDWATASWVEKDSIYLVTAKGGPADVERFLPSA